MWVEASKDGRYSSVMLVCDDCGTPFRSARDEARPRSTVWHRANVAGWARTAANPDRHACASC